jgi:hypothetical protein
MIKVEQVFAKNENSAQVEQHLIDPGKRQFSVSTE